MSIADWLSARENKRYTRVAETVPSQMAGAEVPDGVWVKCESCKKIVYEGELVERARVCPGCGFHFDLTAPQRIEITADEGTFAEIDAELVPCDPLEFSALKPYGAQVESAVAKSGMNEAIMTGTAQIGGHDVVLAAMDFRFIGASMGSVVGEKVVRAFERAMEDHLPLVLFAASGGARMQEGMLSLMQMAKTSAVVRKHAETGLPFVSVLTNPTYGGVTASFAVLADVLLSEPGALIGFSGQRVIEQTIHQKLPKGFQTAEFMLQHGMIDDVVPRDELKNRIALLLSYFAPAASTISQPEGGVL